MASEIVPAAAASLASRSVEIQSIPVEQITGRMKAVEQVVENVMVEGVHWGDVPGVPGQKMIDKPGIEILAATFQLALDYVVDTSTTPDGELRYIAKCRVLQQGTEAYLGSGMGECSTGETKYLWRRASQEEYDAAGEDRRRVKTKTYEDSGKTVETLQVRENNADKANTALKQATTRAARDAVLGVLGVRGMVLQGNRQQSQMRSQERRTQAQSGGGARKASAAQVRKIRSLMLPLGYAADDITKGYPPATTLEELPSGSASAVIDRLMAETKQRADAAAAGVDPTTGEVPDEHFGFESGPDS